MLNLIKQKSFVIIVLVVVLGIIFFKIQFSRIPDMGSFAAQKEYAENIFDRAQKLSWGIILGFDVVIPELFKRALGENTWERSVAAHEYILQKYPVKGGMDVDVLRRLGHSYFPLGDYERSRKFYRENGEAFKARYYKKDYPERAHLSDTRALIEEVNYLVSNHMNIARTYKAQEQYNEAIKEYDKAIGYIGDLEGVRETVVGRIFMRPFEGKAKIYKFIKEDYERGIETYLEMKEKLKGDPIATSQADIFIADAYLAQGDIEKAKLMYKSTYRKYKDKPPVDRGMFYQGKSRIEDIEKGQVVSTEGVVYIIEDGEVTVRLLRGF